MSMLSFVIPCYRSERTIERVIAEIRLEMSKDPAWTYEIIAVDDCSPDGVLGVLRRLAMDDTRIRVLSLAKNVGKHSAMLAGYRIVRGDIVVDLDDDLQCPVPELWRLLGPLLSGDADYVTARYTERVHVWWKLLGSNFNLLLSGFLLEKPKGLRFENFSAMKVFVCREITRYQNPFPYMEGLVLRVTSRIRTVEMKCRLRGDDLATGFTLRKSVSLLLNGLTAFSVKPLRVATVAGSAMGVAGFGLMLWTVIRKLLNPEVPAGFSSLMSVVLCSNGFTMLLLGMMGEYLGRVYICINQSPQYVVRESVNVEEPRAGNGVS